MKLQGIFPALTTPFDDEGNLYKVKVLHNVRKLNEISLGGYTVCGSTGEAPLLTTSERVQMMEWVREASGSDRTLIAGVGCESVRETVSLANSAADCGFPRCACSYAVLLSQSDAEAGDAGLVLPRGSGPFKAAGAVVQHSQRDELSPAARNSSGIVAASQHHWHEG